MEYLLFKVLHLLFVLVFVGNIITGLFWAGYANRSNDALIIAHTFSGIIRSDRIFTMPGVLGLTVAGIAAAILGGFPMLKTGWILWGIILFAISGVVFSVRVAPLQKKIVRLMADTSDPDASDWQRYRHLFNTWKRWGWVATGMPLVAIIVMTLKPNLPGL